MSIGLNLDNEQDFIRPALNDTLVGVFPLLRVSVSHLLIHMLTPSHDLHVLRVAYQCLGLANFHQSWNSVGVNDFTLECK